MAGISTAVGLASGMYHTCALLGDGTAKCWGYDGFGQLGSNVATWSGTPVAVQGLTTVELPSCGDGVVDAGEQCDQGASNGRPGSCCTATCTLAAAGTVCRAAAGACDVAETCNGSAPTCPADGFLLATTVCRAAAGPCDVAEKCTGTAAACPADAFLSPDTTRVTPVGATASGSYGAAIPSLAIDGNESTGWNAPGYAGNWIELDLGQNYLVNQVKLMVAQAPAGQTTHQILGGLAPAPTTVLQTLSGYTTSGDWLTASVAPTSVRYLRVLTTQTPSWVAWLELQVYASGACRAAAGPCDAADLCTGSAAACPDARMPAGTVCRAAAGVCDAPETCDGTSVTCPADAKKVAGTVCRAAIGLCDLAETCNGTSVDCPADALKAAGTTCRAAADPTCDVAETCSGTSAACPPDTVLPPSTVCRAATGPEDRPEYCTGLSGVCPPAGTPQQADACTAMASSSAPLATARRDHVAIALTDGRVLVAGGVGTSVSLGSTELYTPATGAWTTTAAMSASRQGHTVTPIDDGTVLVTGGQDADGYYQATADTYIAPNGSWCATKPLVTARAGHTATRLGADGTAYGKKVLVTGGMGCTPPTPPPGPRPPGWPEYCAGGTLLATADIHDTDTGAWTATGALLTARQGHTATLLGNGKLLVAGGHAGCVTTTCYDGTGQAYSCCPAASGGLASAELYNPATGTWTATGSLATARYEHTATLLGDGRVLVVGGINNVVPGQWGSDALATAEVYDPVAGTWSAAAPLATARHAHTATLLANGKVVVAGGMGKQPLASTEVYNPLTNTWTAGANLFDARYRHTASLVCGKILLAGGAGSASLAATEIFSLYACGDGVLDPGEECDQGAANGAAGSCCTLACHYAAAGTTCRDAAGPCDAAETCTGRTPTCPPDARQPAGTTCRASVGPCDFAETCDGTAVTCPPDGAAQTCPSATGPASFKAELTPAAVMLSWTQLVDPALVAIEVYRNAGPTALAVPGTPAQLVYRQVATSYQSSSSVPDPGVNVNGTGTYTYSAFAIYAPNWSPPATATIAVGDTDRDGMPDAWETANGLNPNDPSDALADPDGDGLSNLQEFLLGTNPRSADSDGDGLKDGWELVHGTNPTAQDTDGDGLNDGFEVEMGLDPTRANNRTGANAMGDKYVLGGYVFDSGFHGLDAAGQPLIVTPATTPTGTPIPVERQYRLATSSVQQMTPIADALEAPTAMGDIGYLTGASATFRANLPPTCSVGTGLTVKVGDLATASVQTRDPDGDPVTVSWSFAFTPEVSALTSANLTGAATSSVSFRPDAYGYYMVQATPSDGISYGAPCYVIITAEDARLFAHSGPAVGFTKKYKLVAATTSSSGALTQSMVYGGRKVGHVLAEAGLSCPSDAAVDCTLINSGLHLKPGFMPAALRNGAYVNNQAPIAVASATPASREQPVGSSFTLSSAGSYDPDAAPLALTYEWRLWQRPYGSAAVIAGADLATATLTTDVAGSYVAMLRVYDGDRYSPWAPIILTGKATNQPPVADAGPNQNLAMSAPPPVVRLSGARSYDPEGALLTYSWSLFAQPTGSLAKLVVVDPVRPTFIADKPGTYRVKLIVRDGSLASLPAYAVINVSSPGGNQPPVAAFGPGMRTLATGNLLVLDGTGSYDPDWDTTRLPDPDNTGVSRKGLSYQWQILSAPASSAAYIYCDPVQSPAYDCPSPTLRFNGANGDYLIGLRVVDGDSLVSDLVTARVSVSGIVDQFPVAVVKPRESRLRYSAGSQNLILGAQDSYDPVDNRATFTYAWTVLEVPNVAGAIAQLNGTTCVAGADAQGHYTPCVVKGNQAQVQLTTNKPGKYRVHVQVWDNTGQSSCGPGESRPAYPACNAASVATIAVDDAAMPVAMPAGWPGVDGCLMTPGGQRDCGPDEETRKKRAPHGSGGALERLSCLNNCDANNPKPVLINEGFSGTTAASEGHADSPTSGALKGVVSMLRNNGYEVWYLTFHPVCSGGAIADVTANWGYCNELFYNEKTGNGEKCACPYPQQPIDNRVALNTVVWAAAARQVFEATCPSGLNDGKFKDPDISSCFVRGLGFSMGGLIGRTAMAWSEDASRTTVGFGYPCDFNRNTNDGTVNEANPGDPYAVCAGATRAKPARGSAGVAAGSDVWELGVRVFQSLDGPQQGANFPVSLQGFFKNYEAKTKDQGSASGSFGGMGHKFSGNDGFAALAIARRDSYRDALARFSDSNNPKDLPEPLRLLQATAGAAKLLGALSYAVSAVKTIQTIAAADAVYAAAAAEGVSGFAALSSLAQAGQLWSPWLKAIGWVGTVLMIAVAIISLPSMFELLGAGWTIAYMAFMAVDAYITYLAVQMECAPWCQIAAVILLIINLVFPDFIMSVSADLTVDDHAHDAIGDGKSREGPSFPFSVKTVLEAPGAKDMLYRVATKYPACAGRAEIMQGHGMPADFGLARPFTRGYGKDYWGMYCQPTGDEVEASTIDHDALYAWIGSLNGNGGWSTKARTTGFGFGGGAPPIDRTVNQRKAPGTVCCKEYSCYGQWRPRQWCPSSALRKTSTPDPSTDPGCHYLRDRCLWEPLGGRDFTSLVDLYLPYNFSNISYPAWPEDFWSGSTTIEKYGDKLELFDMHLTASLKITKRVVGFRSTNYKQLFDDHVYLPQDPIMLALRTGFIPTHSALALTPEPTFTTPACQAGKGVAAVDGARVECDYDLPCCQLVANYGTALAGVNCRANCSTMFDASIMPGRSIPHAPSLEANPCLRNGDWDYSKSELENMDDIKKATYKVGPRQNEKLDQEEWITERERRLCACNPAAGPCDVTDGAGRPSGVAGRYCKGYGDLAVYYSSNADGYRCDPLANEAASREVGVIMSAALATLDWRKGSFPQKYWVCENPCEIVAGERRCGPTLWSNNKDTNYDRPAFGGLCRAMWLGGVDRDGDGCPANPDGSAGGCESAAEDLNPLVPGTGKTFGVDNTPPVISKITDPQVFELPTCGATAGKLGYACLADVIDDPADVARVPLKVKVEATDADTPLRYRWSFDPSKSCQGVSAPATAGPGDVMFLTPEAAETAVVVMTQNRPPQGKYPLVVQVTDQRGARSKACTTVEVKGAPVRTNISISGPTEVNEICEWAADVPLASGEAAPTWSWRCYADVAFTAVVVDANGNDLSNTLLMQWSQVMDTDLQASGYAPGVLVGDANAKDPGLMVLGVENHLATPSGHPLKFRLTVIDVRGETVTRDQCVRICPMDGCTTSAEPCPP
ncbi:MAG TPA: kelch repeat-containing protein [Polyangia bacterium]